MNPYSDSSIVLSPADAVSNNPTFASLTDQTMTIDTSTPFKKTFYLKGENTGKNYNSQVVDVIVCGNEAVTAGSEHVEVNLLKNQGYVSPGVFNSQTEKNYV